MAIGRSNPHADPYAVLGVDRGASAAEIRAAYRALVARYHPDRHQGNPLEDLASERMVEINQAYELLSNTRRRTSFDGGRAGAGAAGTTNAANTTTAAAHTRAGAGGPARRPGMNPVLKWGLFILSLPLFVRTGASLLRAVAGLGRGLFGALGGLRGTPAGFAVALLVGVLLALALWRRRRRGSGGT